MPTPLKTHGLGERFNGEAHERHFEFVLGDGDKGGTVKSCILQIDMAAG